MNEMVSRWFVAVGALGLLAAAIWLSPPAPGTPARTDPTSQSSAMEFESVIVSLDGAPVMGDPGARVGIVEFSDYGCPFCARHSMQVLPEIVRNYVKTGKVRYFFKDLPVEGSHPQAFREAEAARCAGAQGRYWPMHDRLFKNQRAQIIEELPEHAQAIGLAMPEFAECMNLHTFEVQIRNDMAEARQARIQGTPTFFVGRLNPNESRMLSDAMIYGSQNYAAFQAALDGLLNR